MPNDVYITRLAKFLPNDPIPNDKMEDYLGTVNGKASRARRIVLRNNGIQSRHYVINQAGEITHDNAALTCAAINKLTDQQFTTKNIEVLACGTSLPDQMLPSHAVMVHGKLSTRPMEVISPSGACCSGMHAFKYGYLSILAGNSKNAVCSGSEMISPTMRAQNFEQETQQLERLNQNPFLAFEKDFLRWMLSDGAGAALLEDAPRGELSLKIEWIESRSYANEIETCMYAAADKAQDGALKSWKSYEAQDWLNYSVFAMKQDVKLLSKNITEYGSRMLKEIAGKRKLDVKNVDYFLPHLSSEFFRTKVYDSLVAMDMEIPTEKWYTNLTRVGNVGSASIYLMLEELFHSGKLKKGQQLLLMVPESARFSYAYALLTVC